MTSRRALAAVLGLLLAASLAPVKADEPYPVIGEPVLRSDSAWTKTDWGYQHASLNLEPAPPEGYPEDYRWPTIFTMEGYAGASRPAPNAYVRMDDGALMAVLVRFNQGPRNDYAFVQASIRGTECSAGNFNLYDRRHGWDGHHIIEWVAAQPWSNSNVGMFGSSFPGQTAYFVAATQPPSLKTISANLLHSDIYRDIFMPGGVQNFLFPSVWTYGTGPHRLPQNSFENGILTEDEICLQHQLARYKVGDLPQPQNEPAWAALRSVDDDWYVAHAALTFAPSIRIPYYQQNNWHDEQTGPRAAVLWKHIHPDPREIINSEGDRATVIPKKLVLSSGSHGFGGFASRERWAWLDIWLLGMPDTTGLLDDRVVNYFEARGDGTASATKSGDDWPFPDTDWDRIYLSADGSLGFEAPTQADGTRSYLSGVARQNYFRPAGSGGGEIATAEGLPDMLSYVSGELEEDIAIAGPILMDLYASVAGVDTDFFVSVNEVWPDGRISYLQRGLLKASHRRVDPLRSYYVEHNGEDLMVQPYRPHTNPQLLVPDEIVHYALEIFPLGHIFREGNRIQINVHTPPTTDGLWGYTPTHHPPGAVTIHHGSEYPTSILLPIVTPDDGDYGESVGCQIPNGFPCYSRPLQL